MPQSLTFVLVHVVFSTKDRRACLDQATRPDLHAYLATVARNLGCECFRVGGVADHVHLAVGLARTITLAKLVGDLKTSSSHWLKTRGVIEFAWQRGYGAFSVGRSDLDAIVQYIQDQDQHHAKIDFKEEFRKLLTLYGISADERYIWD